MMAERSALRGTGVAIHNTDTIANSGVYQMKVREPATAEDNWTTSELEIYGSSTGNVMKRDINAFINPTGTIPAYLGNKSFEPLFANMLNIDLPTTLVSYVALNGLSLPLSGYHMRLFNTMGTDNTKQSQITKHTQLSLIHI